MWSPLPQEKLLGLAEDAELDTTPAEQHFWSLVRVPPSKWQLHPWGDDGGGFWVVGVLGRQVIWYNDIEDGFNVSRYSIPGTIDEYWCGQSLLRHVVASLTTEIVKRGTSEPSRALGTAGEDIAR